MDWIDEVVEFAKIMTEAQFLHILSLTDKYCRGCGTCCITPDLKFLEKPPGKRCEYLTEDNLCKIHDSKPQPCKDFPYMDNFEWVVKFKLGSPRAVMEFCKILEDFWVKAYGYLIAGGGCFTCQVCNTCESGVSE
jgi:Fe-S-cluster containining protein